MCCLIQTLEIEIFNSNSNRNPNAVHSNSTFNCFLCWFIAGNNNSYRIRVNNALVYIDTACHRDSSNI